MRAIGEKVIVQVIEKKTDRGFIMVGDTRMQREGKVVSIGDQFNKNAGIQVGDMVTYSDTAPTTTVDGVKYAILNEESLYFKVN